MEFIKYFYKYYKFILITLGDKGEVI